MRLKWAFIVILDFGHLRRSTFKKLKALSFSVLSCQSSTPLCRHWLRRNHLPSLASATTTSNTTSTTTTMVNTVGVPQMRRQDTDVAHPPSKVALLTAGGLAPCLSSAVGAHYRICRKAPLHGHHMLHQPVQGIAPRRIGHRHAGHTRHGLDCRYDKCTNVPRRYWYKKVGITHVPHRQYCRLQIDPTYCRNGSRACLSPYYQWSMRVG